MRPGWPYDDRETAAGVEASEIFPTGTDVVHYFLYRTSFILIIAPLEYLQDNDGQEIFEAHLSSWCPLEFSMHTDLAYVSAGTAWLGLLRGFKCPRARFRSVVTRLRAHRLKYVKSIADQLLAPRVPQRRR